MSSPPFAPDPRFIERMFSEIAPRYDFLNRLLSLGRDRGWRRACAEEAGRLAGSPAGPWLDACAGTADLALSLAAAVPRGQALLVADFSLPMLRHARRKLDGVSRPCYLLAADTLRLPFAEASLELATVAFGLRNLVGVGGGLRELGRVLRPGGYLMILEFSMPRRGPFAFLYRQYLARSLPRLGNRLSASRREAYSYLARSIKAFSRELELAAALQSCGFRVTSRRRLTFGIVELIAARKA